MADPRYEFVGLFEVKEARRDAVSAVEVVLVPVPEQPPEGAIGKRGTIPKATVKVLVTRGASLEKFQPGQRYRMNLTRQAQEDPEGSEEEAAE